MRKKLINSVKMTFGKYRINQVVAAFIATMGGFGVGMGLAWTATSLPSYNDTGHLGDLTSSEKSWVASLLTVGALLACPVTGYLLNGVGRKACLLCLTAIAFPGWLLLAAATHPKYVYIGRILTGLSTGGYCTVIPIYIREIASKSNRGKLGSLFLVMLCLGKLFSNSVGIMYPANIASLLCSLHPVVYGLLLLLIPESPTYLESKDKLKEAQRSRSWLQAKGLNLPFPWSFPVADIESGEKKSGQGTVYVIPFTTGAPGEIPKASFTSSEVVKPSLLVFVLMLLAQFCGINVATFYTVEIFRYSGSILMEPEFATVILALIQTIGCIPSCIFVDKYGRKVLMLSSFIAMTLALSGFAAYFYVKDFYSFLLADLPFLGVLPLISLVIYSLAFSWGVGSLVWIIMSEILPPHVLGPASAVANLLYWGGAFCVTQMFQMFKDSIPLYIWFASFALVCIFGCVFNFLFLPETKGLSLRDIQALYAEKSHKQCTKL